MFHKDYVASQSIVHSLCMKQNPSKVQEFLQTKSGWTSEDELLTNNAVDLRGSICIAWCVIAATLFPQGSRRHFQPGI